MYKYDEKKEFLYSVIAEMERPAIAYSGGVDSSLLAAVAFQFHPDAVAIMTLTEAIAVEDIAYAKRQADAAGWNLEMVNVEVLKDECIAYNFKERCYYCKRRLLSAIKKRGTELGCQVFLEGSNDEDAIMHRPGSKAVLEARFLSPLAVAGFSKADVRRFAAELGIPSATRHSKPCLLTRFPYGLSFPIDAEILARIESGENLLSGILKDNFRLRYVDNDTARIEASLRDQEYLKKEGKRYLRRLPFYSILIDETPFSSGSFDRKDQEHS